MVTTRGKADVKRYMAELPVQLNKVLRGAARAGAAVIADEARERCSSEATRDAIVVQAKSDAGHITVSVTVKPGFGRSIGYWLEYGTDPHFISVDPAFSAGRSAGRINRLDNRAAEMGRKGPGATLVINGKPVGSTVYHPGAREEPFLRPALDLKKDAAIAAAQSYINARVKPNGITGSADPEEDEA